MNRGKDKMEEDPDERQSPPIEVPRKLGSTKNWRTKGTDCSEQSNIENPLKTEEKYKEPGESSKTLSSNSYAQVVYSAAQRK